MGGVLAELVMHAVLSSINHIGDVRRRLRTKAHPPISLQEAIELVPVLWSSGVVRPHHAMPERGKEGGRPLWPWSPHATRPLGGRALLILKMRRGTEVRYRGQPPSPTLEDVEQILSDDHTEYLHGDNPIHVHHLWLEVGVLIEGTFSGR